MLFGQHAVEEQANQSGRHDACERDGGYAEWRHALTLSPTSSGASNAAWSLRQQVALRDCSPHRWQD